MKTLVRTCELTAVLSGIFLTNLNADIRCKVCGTWFSVDQGGCPNDNDIPMSLGEFSDDMVCFFTEIDDAVIFFTELAKCLDDASYEGVALSITKNTCTIIYPDNQLFDKFPKLNIPHLKSLKNKLRNTFNYNKRDCKLLHAIRPMVARGYGQKILNCFINCIRSRGWDLYIKNGNIEVGDHLSDIFNEISQISTIENANLYMEEFKAWIQTLGFCIDYDEYLIPFVSVCWKPYETGEYHRYKVSRFRLIKDLEDAQMVFDALMKRIYTLSQSQYKKLPKPFKNF